VQDIATAGGGGEEGAVQTVTEPAAKQLQAALGEEGAEQGAGEASAGGCAGPVQSTATAPLAGLSTTELDAWIAGAEGPELRNQLDAALKRVQELDDERVARHEVDGISTAGKDQNSDPYTAMAGSAPNAASSGRGESLPRRLSGLPLQGLPASVVDQLQKFDTAWPAEELSVWMAGECGLNYYQGLSEEQQQALLHDLLQLNAVFLAEVPVSVGCSNPGCVSLAGVSEVAVSNKGCTGCKVVFYCSKDCQVEDWKVHKKMCKQLKQHVISDTCDTPGSSA
jgi:hypothetical protein